MTSWQSFFIAYILLIFLSGCHRKNDKTPLNIHELTIQDIHQAFEDGKYNSQDLVSAYIERIGQFDTSINSIVLINPNALRIARELDEEYRRTGQLRPLHGIPVIVKNNIHTKGLVTDAGSLALQDFIPENDAFIISKLEQAGAIVLAKSNMAEWALTPWGSFSSTNGANLNAYNPEYSPAGSSGGTGSAIAANFGVVGLGTDTGGSIRLPASHGSLAGLRPTMGLVSRSGIVPCNLPNDMAGPMCRTVEDVARVLEIICGEDEEDALTQFSRGNIPDNYTQFLNKEGLKGSRIGVFREIADTAIDPDILALFERAIGDMKSQGATIIDPVSIPGFASLRQNQWCDDFRNEIENHLVKYVRNDTIKSLEDLIRIGSKSKFTTQSLKYSSTHRGMAGNPEAECLDAYTDLRRIAFRKAIEHYMDSLEIDALVYPSWNIKPYRMDSIVEEYIGDNTGVVAPITGQPAFSIPMGFMKNNLPTGIEFLGRMYAEPTLLKLAYAYEQATKHRKEAEIKNYATNDRMH